MRFPFLALMAAALPLGAQARSSAASSPLIPAAREFRHQRTITMDYHEASGYGTVEVRDLPLAATPTAPAAALTAMFVYRGQRLTRPPGQVSLAITTHGRAPGAAGASELVFRLEGAPGGRARVVAGPAIHQPAVDGADGETIALRMSAVDFLTVVDARRAAVRAGTAEWVLDEETMEVLRDVASRMSPATFDHALSALSATTRVPDWTLRREWLEASEVDQRAAPTMVQLLPALPAGEPVDSTGRRRVAIEYVVDSAGRVELTTLKARDPQRDARIVDAIRALADRWEFDPARKGGRPVPQRVLQVVVLQP